MAASGGGVAMTMERLTESPRARRVDMRVEGPRRGGGCVAWGRVPALSPLSMRPRLSSRRWGTGRCCCRRFRLVPRRWHAPHSRVVTGDAALLGSLPPSFLPSCPPSLPHSLTQSVRPVDRGGVSCSLASCQSVRRIQSASCLFPRFRLIRSVLYTAFHDVAVSFRRWRFVFLSQLWSYKIVHSTLYAPFCTPRFNRDVSLFQALAFGVFIATLKL